MRGLFRQYESKELGGTYSRLERIETVVDVIMVNAMLDTGLMDVETGYRLLVNCDPHLLHELPPPQPVIVHPPRSQTGETPAAEQ